MILSEIGWFLKKVQFLGDRVYSIIISVDSVKNNQLNIQNHML